MVIKKTLLITLILIYGNNLFSQDPEGGHERWEYMLEGSGDMLQIALPLTACLITLSEKDYNSTKQIILSFATTSILTYSLKHFTEKKRPEGRNRYDSFPSGHTSAAFSGASFIQRKYGLKAGISSYILAGIVGVSRMEGPDGYHDFWDVFGGAAIGIGSTYIFTKSYQKKPIEVGFASNKDMKMLTIYYKF